MKLLFVFVAALAFTLPSHAQQSPAEKEVLGVVNRFFTALEAQDTAAFSSMCMNDARFYIVATRNDTVRTFSRAINPFTFHKDQILKERMRDTGVVVQVHDRIATVWAPYDIWINNKFSHCGVDVFTLLKSSRGWKIASCSYTVETEGCR